MIALFVGAFMAGLVGSPHCIGMCGPFAVLCGDRASRSVAWHLGRLTTYAALGAVAGTAGRLLPGPSWIVTLVSAVLIIWFAGSLAGVWPEPNIVPPYLRRLATATAGAPGLAGRAVFGLANGLLPCGLVYAALSIPVAVADPWLGALAMLAFGLGTVPALAVATVGLRTVLARDRRTRRLLAVGVLLAGLWVIGGRAGYWSPLLGTGGHSQGATHENGAP